MGDRRVSDRHGLRPRLRERSACAIQRLHELKGRPADKPSALMWFSQAAALDCARAPRPAHTGRGRAPLPGPVLAVVPGPDGGTLGVRVPRLEGPLEPLAEARAVVLQTSANLTGGQDPRRVVDVPETILTGVDLVLDGGELRRLAIVGGGPDRIRGRPLERAAAGRAGSGGARGTARRLTRKDLSQVRRDRVGVIVQLPPGDPDKPPAARAEHPVARAIALEGRRCPVSLPAVELSDHAALAPEEVALDPTPGDEETRVDLGLGEARLSRKARNRASSSLRVTVRPVSSATRIASIVETPRRRG